MKKHLIILIVCLMGWNANAELSCGAGYVLTPHAKVDEINAMQCQKVWCIDLETGRYMGTGTKANSGYVDSGLNEICDKNGRNCVQCFGERKWCSGQTRGVWNPEYGAYMRSDSYSDSEVPSYISFQKGNCYAWRLAQPNCGADKVAVLDGDKWICTTRIEDPELIRKSTIRRTSTVRSIR